MSQQNACGGPTCGCSSMCLHPEPPAGSSVPEAARAARTVRWGERFRLAQTKYSAGASRPDVAAALMALADAEVAAAVAEERATTGRRDAERERYIKTLVKERDAAERKVRAVETVTCWTNEDGKRFMFVDDVAAALEVPGSVVTA